MSLQTTVVEKFVDVFGGQPTLVARAPGRVNLIGEHTDYNDGFVLPMAIDRAVWIALRPRDDGKVVLHSVDLNDSGEFDLNEPLIKNEAHSWFEYVRGVAWALQKEGHQLCGWEGVMSGDVPIGSGLSSSAALQMAVSRAFASVSTLTWDNASMALMVQRVENKWMGVNTGIMDQMISASGEAGSALLIDCRSLETMLVPLPPATKVIVLDTAVRRGLVDSKYNERRSQCEEAADHLGKSALRDVSLEAFIKTAPELAPLTRKRARHVVTEDARTLQAVEAMRAGDAVTLGLLMNASHESLKNDFEVTVFELDKIVEIARAQAGCFGARMTGAGFGGCAVALVAADSAETFTQTVAAQYEAATGLTPNIYVCVATQGAETLQHA
ncbi:MAG: galactokinase [Candidatus Promineifilaceae bacterium]